jgi:tRNA(fMet)-specific endonuclease VapC
VNNDSLLTSYVERGRTIRVFLQFLVKLIHNAIGVSLVTSPSTYHLDTNIVVAYFNGNQAIAEKIKASLPHVSISALVLGELLYGARASQRQQENLEKIYQFLRIVQVHEYDQACAEQYSHLRVKLRHKGKPTGEVDTLIAAIALAHNAILVTDNTKHFIHIDGLPIENWLLIPEKQEEDSQQQVSSEEQK